MDLHFKDTVTEKWRKYFKNAELPFVFYYSDDEKY